MKNKIDSTLLRFIIVGVINTIFGTAIMFIFYNIFNFNYWISSASNYFFGSILSFFLNKYFTFKNKDRSIRQVIYFILNISVCYLFAYGLAKPMVKVILSNHSLKTQENIAMLIGMGFFVVLNYLGQRVFVFKKREEN